MKKVKFYHLAALLAISVYTIAPSAIVYAAPTNTQSVSSKADNADAIQPEFATVEDALHAAKRANVQSSIASNSGNAMHDAQNLNDDMNKNDHRNMDDGMSMGDGREADHNSRSGGVSGGHDGSMSGSGSTSDHGGSGGSDGSSGSGDSGGHGGSGGSGGSGDSGGGHGGSGGSGGHD